MVEKICARCTSPAVSGLRYCKRHGASRVAKRPVKYSKRTNPNPPKKNPFYNTIAWIRLSKITLDDNPQCESCKRMGKVVMADHVDHILSIGVAPDRRLDPSNLQSLCRACHRGKTHKEYKGLYTDFINGRFIVLKPNE